MYIVYRHTNKSNGMIYIGMTQKTIEKRWNSGYRNNPHFHRAIKKYGWDGFYHEVVANGLTKEKAEEIEKYYIAKHNSTNPAVGYNIELGGNSTGKHSEKTKQKISAAQKGRTFTEEHRSNMSKAHKGLKHTAEQRAKISNQMLGNKNTLGYRHTEETKQKMSESHKGKHGKPVICLSDGKFFKSVVDAANFYGLTRHKVLNNCTGKTKRLYGSDLKFSYV